MPKPTARITDDDAYPLKGQRRFDLSGEEAYALTPDARARYVADLLVALHAEEKAGRLRLKKVPKFRDEMRELRRLVRWRTDTRLTLDEHKWQRNVLMRPSPAHSTHSTHAAEAMVRMGTSFGHLPTKLKDAAAWARTHHTPTHPLTDAFYRQQRAAKAVPELFVRIYRLLDTEDATKAAYRNYTRQVLRDIYGHLLSHYNLRSAFPPFHARFLVDYYAPKTGDVVVLDPCAGWGGRLLGSLTIPRQGKVTYVGVDPNRDNQFAYERLTHRVTHYLRKEPDLGERAASVAPLPFEDWLKSQAAKRLRGKVDVAITSPPYFAAEVYQQEDDKPQHQRTQSSNRYNEYEGWIEGFLRPMCDGVAALLKPNGVFILNIANVQNNNTQRLEDHANALLKDAGLVREKDLWKLAMARAVGTQSLNPKHAVLVEGVPYRYEPCFVWRKPEGWTPRRGKGIVIRAPKRKAKKATATRRSVKLQAVPPSRWRAIKSAFVADYASLGNNGAKHGIVLKGWLTAGEMWALGDEAFARVRRATQSRAVPMFRRQDVSVGQRHRGDWVVESILLRTDKGRDAFAKMVSALDGVVWLETLAGDKRADAAIRTLNAERIGTTYTSEGDVLAVSVRGSAADIKERRASVDAAELAQVRRLSVSPSSFVFRRFQHAALAAVSGAAMANHYSKKNKGKSWSALSLYGFSDDPTDIAKPSEVSGTANPRLRPTRLLTKNAELRTATDALLKACGITHERVRLMKLAASADAGVERHSDLTDTEHGVADGQLARIHLPIQTNPNAVLYGWDADNERRCVHLAEGAWFYLDARKPHAIQNTGRSDRIHLVVDVVSNERVRRLIASSTEVPSVAMPSAAPIDADYIAPDGTGYSREQLSALVKGWRVSPRPRVEKHNGVSVVRDDVLPYGAKMRCLDALLSSLPDIEEVVFGSVSATGLGGVALAEACKRHGKRCVLFMAKRALSKLTPHQREMRKLGAVIRWVPNGMLNVTTARAREYADKSAKRLFLPLGLEHPVVVAAMMKTAQSLNLNPKVVVSSASSGTLNRALQLAFPEARVLMVPSHHTPSARERGRAELVPSPFRERVPDDQLPPFPSVPTWDAMAWVVAQKHSPCLFWNIGTDERFGDA